MMCARIRNMQTACAHSTATHRPASDDVDPAQSANEPFATTNAQDDGYDDDDRLWKYGAAQCAECLTHLRRGDTPRKTTSFSQTAAAPPCPTTLAQNHTTSRRDDDLRPLAEPAPSSSSFKNAALCGAYSLPSSVSLSCWLSQCCGLAYHPTTPT